MNNIYKQGNEKSNDYVKMLVTMYLFKNEGILSSYI